MYKNRDDIDLVSRLSGLGNLTEATSNIMMGFNHRNTGTPVPYNTDHYGLTFFTRPRMNLSYDNIVMDRRLTPLSAIESKDSPSYQRAIRVLLDPLHSRQSSRSADGKRESGLITSMLVDDLNPFIPLLSNQLISLNGWPDPVMGMYNSREGAGKESWFMADDIARHNGTFDLQASFRNIAGDPITLLLQTWLVYMENVYTGRMYPHPSSVVENEIDYLTRIYRIVLDPTRRFVQKIAACGAAAPSSSGLGAAFNMTTDVPFNQEVMSQISIPFHCTVAMYQDPILIREFNDLVVTFNPAMGDVDRASKMRQVAQEYLELFNYYGYPRIDPRTMEMQWWVKREWYEQQIATYNDMARQSAPPPLPPALSATGSLLGSGNQGTPP